MTPDTRQPRRVSRHRARATWATLGAALLIHGGLLGTVHAFDLVVAGTPKLIVTTPPVSLETTCSGKVLLAASARLAHCLAPWSGGDLERCRDDAAIAFWMDLSACQEDTGALAAAAPVEMVAPKQVEKLAVIDPEPLLEELEQLVKDEQPPPPPPQIQEQQPPPPPPPPPPQPQRPQQVVETAKPNTEQEPINSRLVSENNVMVEKQTVARGSVNEPMVAKSSPAELTPKQEPKPASMKELPPEPPGKEINAPDAAGALSMRKPGAPNPSEAPQQATDRGLLEGAKGPLVADGWMARRGSGMIQQDRRDPGELTRGQGGAGGGAPQTPNLKPTDEALERALGGGSVDHLDDVESGDETQLSSRRWVYASFFNRLKRQVAQNWHPADVWRRNDPDGTVNGFKTRVTEVRVSLSAAGQLQKIVITTPSGVAELDEEAVRSFHAAAPFPNPPDGLVGKEGLITFAFSFHFEIGAPRTTWRVIQ